MKILVDVDDLRDQGLISQDTARLLQDHALRDTGSTAINILLGLGAVAVSAGIVALTQSAAAALAIGLLLIFAGWALRANMREMWGKLGSICMIVGALEMASAFSVMMNHPLIGAAVAAMIFAVVAVLAQSSLMAALVPPALAAAIGGSTGYWFACYEIVVREPTLTILLFAILTYVGWQLAKRFSGWQQRLSLAFTRMCIILVNFGFWIGSFWGDTPGNIWRSAGESDSIFFRPDQQQIPPLVFVIGWAAALAAAGYWAAKNGRRFLVNTVAVFGAIHLYTQWFERFGAEPFAVIAAGLATIAIGMAFFRYNRNLVAPSAPAHQP